MSSTHTSRSDTSVWMQQRTSWEVILSRVNCLFFFCSPKRGQVAGKLSEPDDSIKDSPECLACLKDFLNEAGRHSPERLSSIEVVEGSLECSWSPAVTERPWNSKLEATEWSASEKPTLSHCFFRLDVQLKKTGASQNNYLAFQWLEWSKHNLY